MFEEYTEEYFMDQAREMGQALEVDTRQGSVYMDAATGHCIRTAKFYNDLSLSFDMLFIDTCVGEILDEKTKERQIFRKIATPSYYVAKFEGVPASDMIGNRFMVDGYYFVLQFYDKGYYLKSERTGSETNSILPKAIIPVKNVTGLSVAEIGELYIPGTDKENDESLRERYKTAIAGPAENGNRQQYKTWCEAYEGVGRAIIFPLAYGANTVKAVIIGTNGKAPTKSLIEEIQTEIDPGSSGFGEGMAPIGCKFFAKAVGEVEINISFSAELFPEYTQEAALNVAKINLSNYLKDIALGSNDEMMVKYVKVISILANSPGIKDLSNLLLNGGTGNINVESDKVGVLGEVTLHVGI